jgi:hypothetical protein
MASQSDGNVAFVSFAEAVHSNRMIVRSLKAKSA